MNSPAKTIIGLYAVIGFFFAVYEHFWGAYSYKSFAYNLGQGVVWPAVMFPVVGQIIGGVLTLVIIGAIALMPRKND
jgi:hypothetical protein